MRLSDLDDVARRHHGLVTLGESGLTNDAWHRALRAGSLIEVHRHVARLPGTEPSLVQRIHAAVLAGGHTAMASHHSAAVLWGLIDIDDPFAHVVLGDARRHPRLTDVIVHRPRDRQRLRPLRRARIACTDPLRTLADLGATHPTLVSTAVGVALRSGLVSLEALETTVIGHARRGRSGVPRLRDAVEEWKIDRRLGRT